jgi:hypothetical protein
MWDYADCVFTPKPFVGHIDVIQRNAISSWLRLHPDVEVILVDIRGQAEVSRSFDLHITSVKRNRYGTNIWQIFMIRRRWRLGMRLFVMWCDIILMAVLCGSRKVLMGRSGFDGWTAVDVD